MIVLSLSMAVQTKILFPCTAPPLQTDQPDQEAQTNEQGINKIGFFPIKKRFDNFYVHHHLINQPCESRVLLVPLSTRLLKFPEFEILPNDDVCIGGRKMPKGSCMPKDPTLYEFKLGNKAWSLFVSSSFEIDEETKAAALNMY